MPKKSPRLRFRFDSRPGWITSPLVFTTSLSRAGIEVGDYAHFGPAWEEVESPAQAAAALSSTIVAEVPGALVERRGASLAVSIERMGDTSRRIDACARLEETLSTYGAGDLVRVFEWGLEPARAAAVRAHGGDRALVASAIYPTVINLMAPYLDGRRRTRTDVALLAHLQGSAHLHAVDAARWQYRYNASGTSYVAKIEAADEAERQLLDLARGGWISGLDRLPPNQHGSVEFVYQPSDAFRAFHEDELVRL